MSDLAPVLVSVAMFLAIGWIVKTVGTNRRLERLARMHGELQQKVLDKMGSSQETIAYLQTEPGKRLLDAPVIERGSPYARVLGSVQAGIILALLGVSLLVVRPMVPLIADKTGFLFIGVLCLALGVGFLVSAYAAHVLSKTYGLIDGSRSSVEA
jgi:hypothetical protein